MGDFKPSKELQDRLPKPVLSGIENHRLVDRLTDKYPPVKDLKRLFSPGRRRFAGIVTDIAFDYYLIKHWNLFETQEFEPFVQQCYAGLEDCLHWMPPRMHYVVSSMIEHGWLSNYVSLEGIARSIDQVSKRMRFENNMAGSIIEIERNYEQIEQVFLTLFAFLKEEVEQAALER